jgi:hypothetical protein
VLFLVQSVIYAFLRHVPTFLRLTEHADVDVRSSAGENIALIFESLSQMGFIHHGRADIADRLLALSKNSSKKTSKKDRKEQRSVFRDVYKTVAVFDIYIYDWWRCFLHTLMTSYMARMMKVPSYPFRFKTNLCVLKVGRR